VTGSERVLSFSLVSRHRPLRDAFVVGWVRRREEPSPAWHGIRGGDSHFRCCHAHRHGDPQCTVTEAMEVMGAATSSSFVWCAEHVRQLGGASPLPNAMEVKG